MPSSSGPVARVKVVMTNQDDAVTATGHAEIELPTPLSVVPRRLRTHYRA